MIQNQLGIGIVRGNADNDIITAFPNNRLIDLAHFLGDIADELGAKLRDMLLRGALACSNILLFAQSDQSHLVGIIAAAQIHLHLAALGKIGEVQRCYGFAHIFQRIRKLYLRQQGVYQRCPVIGNGLRRRTAPERQYHSCDQQQTYTS